MLVLTRLVGEKVVVGEEVVVTILGVKDGKVQLGVAAPPDIAVIRKEPQGTGSAIEGQPSSSRSAVVKPRLALVSVSTTEHLPGEDVARRCEDADVAGDAGSSANQD